MPARLRSLLRHRDDVWETREEAVSGFGLLGADAQEAVPALIKLFERRRHSRYFSRYAVVLSLERIGPAAVPTFVRSLSVADDRETAIKALWDMHDKITDSGKTVPALANVLSDTNHVTRQLAAMLLEHFGTNAQAAVPGLLRLVNDPDPYVHEAVNNALFAIDPQAAGEVGIKARLSSIHRSAIAE